MRLLPLGYLAVLATALLVAGCDPSVSYAERTESPTKRGQGNAGYGPPREGLFGPGGLSLLGGNDKPEPSTGGSPIAVNSYLWRASLDTISFMPLTSADPFGGVIITDWYSPAEVHDERFKVNIYILGRELRADGVRAAVFRQRQDPFEGWVDAEVSENTSTDLENAILTRARELRIAGAGS
jgi:Domain of unknown function (DUF3576)